MRILLTAGIAAFVIFVIGSLLVFLSGGSYDGGQRRAAPLQHLEGPEDDDNTATLPESTRADKGPDNVEGLPTAVVPRKRNGAEPLPRGGGEVAVDVLDGDDVPIVGAEVELLTGRSAEVLLTGEDGAAIFQRLPPGAYTLRLRISDRPELESARAIDLQPEERKRLTLHVGAFDRSLSGRIMDRDGTPIRGVVVKARRRTLSPDDLDLIRLNPESLRTTSDARGAYTLDGLESTDYFVFTESTQKYSSEHATFWAGSTSADLFLSATRKMVIYGRVLDDQLQPVTRTRVVALGFLEAVTTTGSDGRYEVELGVPDQRQTVILQVSHPGFREARVNVPLTSVGEGSRREVDVYLEPIGLTVTVNGTLTNESGAPISGEQVFLYSRVRKARYSARTDRDGGFSMSDVQLAEDYKVWVYPQSEYKDFSQRPVVIDESGLELKIELGALEFGDIHGVMLDPVGAPVPGFRLWLHSTEAQGKPVSVVGDDSGRFSVRDVPAGDLVFETRSTPQFTIRGIRLSAEESADVLLVLDWGEHDLSGLVTDEEGEPVPGAKVTLYWNYTARTVKSTSFRRTVTDSEGRYMFSELSAGTHRIYVVSGKYRGSPLSFEVGGAKETAVIELRAGRR